MSDGDARKRRSAFAEHVLSTIPIEEYDLDVARSHATLMAATRRSGRPRGAHDLIIAATARAFDLAIISADASAFEDLPGVTVLAT